MSQISKYITQLGIRSLASTLLLCSSLIAAAYPLSYYSSESVLADGHWVRIEMDDEGIYQVSYDQLREWGFSNPENVAVYGYSPVVDYSGNFTEDHIDDLPQQPTLHTSDGRILFYSQGVYRLDVTSNSTANIRRNYYDTKAVLFLSDSNPVNEITTSSYSTKNSANPFQAHYCVVLHEDEAQNVGEGGVFYHGPMLPPGTTQKYSFEINDYSTLTTDKGANGAGYIKYEFGQNSEARGGLTTEVQFDGLIKYKSDNLCPALTNSYYFYSTASGYMRFEPNSTGPDSHSTLVYSFTNPASSVASYTALDRITMFYPRLNRLGSQSSLVLQFTTATTANQRVEIMDAPEGTEVWNVENPFKPFRYASVRSSQTPSSVLISLPSVYNSKTHPARLVAFNVNATHPTPRYTGEVSNSNLHGSPTPELLIITTTTLRDCAEELAEIHRRYQGMDVIVATQEEIFNEFSSGVRTPMAYRRAAKMFYDREPDQFKYLLLYGPGSWDNRQLVLPALDRLVTFQAEIFDHARDMHRNYTADLVFGMLEDNYEHTRIHFQPTQIAVGRMNLSNEAQARSANKKVESALLGSLSSTAWMRAVISSDSGDGYAHYDQSEAAATILNQNIPGITITRAHVNLYALDENDKATTAHEVLMRAFERGQGLFTFCGHGQAAGISYDKKLLISSHAAKMTYSTPSFAHFSTCDLFCFDRGSSLMDEMLATPSGGLIGGIAASRSVFLQHNQPLHLAVVEAYTSAVPGTTYGQLLMNARNNILTTQNPDADRAVNILAYNTGGDPAVLIPVPSYRIVLDKINGVEYDNDAESPTILEPQTVVRFEGHLERINGGSADDFNGTGMVEIYDGPTESPLQNPPTKHDPTQLTDQTILTTRDLKITDGTFSFTMTLPQGLTPDVSNRMVLTAHNPETLDHAAGFATNLCVSSERSASTPAAPESAPAIKSLYIDTPSFVDGDIVSSEFTLCAEIDPGQNGLNVAEGPLGAGIRLTYDVSTSFPGVGSTLSYDENGHAWLRKSFKDIAEGRHSFELSVLDNMGSYASSRVDFTVSTSEVEGILSLVADEKAPATDENGLALAGPLPVRRSLEISLDHNAESEPYGKIIVTNASGETVYHSPETILPTEWDLRGMDGKRVPDGPYTVHALLRHGVNYGSTPHAHIIVIE